MQKTARSVIIDAIGLGIGLWLIGYIGSILLFSFVSTDILGWILFIVLAPVALLITYFRFRKRSETTKYYLFVALVWVAIAIVFDYLFIVKLFNPPNYYKADVFVYYAMTFLIPLAVGYKFGRGKG